jgi:hypothetical protein
MAARIGNSRYQPSLEQQSPLERDFEEWLKSYWPLGSDPKNRGSALWHKLKDAFEAGRTSA